jgi:hypothetical protein
MAVGAGMLLVLGTATSCGSDANVDGASGAGQADALADRAGLESEAVVDAICDGWALDQPDQPTVNEYVHDLLRPLDRVNSADPPAYTADEIDALVVEACREERDDPEAFLGMVRDGLGLSEADLDALVMSACDRYRVQQERMASGDWSGEDIAQFIRDLAADRDVGLGELREALSGICT